MSILVGDIDRARLAHDYYSRDRTPQNLDGGYDAIPSPGPGPDRAAAYLLDWTSGKCVKQNLGPSEFDHQIPHGEGDGQKLLVLRGLPPEYVDLLVADRVCSGKHVPLVDPGFIDALARRGVYRPAGRRRGGFDAWPWFESWAYPDLVQNPGPTRYGDGGRDGASVVMPLNQGDLAVAFRRLSLWWRVECTPILFLDPDRETHARETQMPSLEDAIPSELEALPNVAELPGNMLVELVYDRWLTLFETLRFSGHESKALVACFWQMQHSLEQNKHAASPLREANDQKIPPYIDWSGLLSQLHQRTTLLSVAAQRRFVTPTLTPAGTGLSQTGRSSRAGAQGAIGTLPPGRTPGRSGREILDENHRALDRISYLGGILIPLPIVSGILSMSDEYGPDGSKFYIFWAVSIPLSVVAVLIIYADTLRKAEVWVEVAGEHAAALPADAAQGAEGAEGVQGDEKGRTWRRRPKVGHDEEAQLSLDKPGIAEQGLPEEEESDAEPVLPVLVSLGPGLLGVEQEEAPDMIVERPTDGRRAKAWTRKKLGWGGAARSILVNHKPRYCANEWPDGIPVYRSRGWQRGGLGGPGGGMNGGRREGRGPAV